MKALVFRGSRKLEVEEVPDPVPAQDGVILQVLAAGVCGSDIHGYEGSNGRRFPGQVMGHEAVGLVVQAGKYADDALGQVMTFTPIVSCGSCPPCLAGQDNRCATRKLIGVHPDLPGAFAEKVAVPRANLLPWSSPSAVAGTLVEPLSVVWRALSTLTAVNPQRVLVLGAGTIGSLGAVALKKRLGAEIDIYDPVAWKSEWLAPLGINVLESVDLTGDESRVTETFPEYDAVLDCVGSSVSFGAATERVAVGGRVHILGMARPVIDYPLERAVTKEVSVTTSYAYNRKEFTEAAQAAEDLEGILMAMEPVTCDLEGAAEKIDSILRPDNRVSKVVITP